MAIADAVFFSAALLFRSSRRSIDKAALWVLGALPSPLPAMAEAPKDRFVSMGSVTGRLDAFVDLG